MKKTLIILMASMLSCFGQSQTNKINNTATIYNITSPVKMGTNLNMSTNRINNLLAGVTPLDAVNFSQLTNTLASGGNVYTYSNNFFNPNLTNTFNGPVVMTGTNFPGINNFVVNAGSGSFMADQNGTNLYYKGSIGVWASGITGSGTTTNTPSIDGYTIFSTNAVDGSDLGRYGWNSTAISAGFGVAAYFKGVIFETNSTTRPGTAIEVYARKLGDIGAASKRFHFDHSGIVGDAGNNSYLTNWAGYFNHVTMVGITGSTNVFNMATNGIENLLAGSNALSAVNLSQLAGITNNSFLYISNINYQVSSIPFTLTNTLDFAGAKLQTINVTNNIAFLSTNITSGSGISIRLVCDTANHNLSWLSGWSNRFLNAQMPASIASNKVAVLSLQAYGSGETNVVAGYGVTP